MHRALVVALGPLLAQLGCSSEINIDSVHTGGSGGATTSTSSHGEGGFAPHPACTSADGVHLCGGLQDCPEPDVADCPGYGCTAALDRDALEPSSAGVCWANVPLGAAVQCTACKDGQVCAHRSADQLVCVSPEVCEALWDLGATTACRYADKSSYDHQHLPVPAGACPGEHGLFCGGACGGCPDDFYCTGRSPRHPFGVCVLVEHSPAGYEPMEAQPCALAPSGVMLQSCEQSIVWGAVCGVFSVPDGDVPWARQYGVCLGPELCVEAAHALPGGMHCYDDSGNQLAP